MENLNKPGSGWGYSSAGLAPSLGLPGAYILVDAPVSAGISRSCLRAVFLPFLWDSSLIHKLTEKF